MSRGAWHRKQGNCRRRVGAAYLEKRLGHHRTTLQRWADAGQFPQPHTVGPSKKRLWFEDEIDNWEAKQLEDRVSA